MKHDNEKKHMIELWQKMSVVQEQTNHSNIADVVLRRIRKYCGKKIKPLQKKKNKNTKHILRTKRVFLYLKNVHAK